MGLIDKIDGFLTLGKSAIYAFRSGVGLARQLQSMREELLTVHKRAAALEEEKLELAERLAEITDFGRQRDQYVMTTLSTGAVVYVPAGSRERKKVVTQPVQDPGRREDEPPIRLCANCFEQRRCSYLQPVELKFRVDTYSCQTCGAKVLIPNDRPARAYTVPVKRRQFW